MKIIAKPIQGGKTIDAIRLASETGGYMVCANEDEAHRVADVARSMNLRIAFPLTFQEFASRRYHIKGCRCFIIDNADHLLQYLAGGVPVVAATVTSNAERPGTTGQRAAWWPIKGVRVDGDKVIVAAKGGNEAARWLCGELLDEINRPEPVVCGNCDTPLPDGCGGLFKDDGRHCRLNTPDEPRPAVGLI